MENLNDPITAYVPPTALKLALDPTSFSHGVPGAQGN